MPDLLRSGLIVLLSCALLLGTAVALPADLQSGSAQARASSKARLAQSSSEAGSTAYACRQNVYPRDDSRAPYSAHVAGIVEAPSGDLLYWFDGGTGRGPDRHGRGWDITRAYTSRMAEGDGSWTYPEEVVYEDDPDGDPAHNTVLFNDGAGRIHNFFTTRKGGHHSDSTLDYRYSDDDGHSWSPAVRIREEFGWMFGTRPFRMSNGEAIVPVYRETFPNGVGFFISDDNFESWETYPSEDDTGWPGSTASGMQAATVELEPGHLVAFLRTQARFIYRTESFDYGRTWTPAVPTRFPNPWSRVDLLATDSGNLILAYNPSYSDRTPLTLALSEDGGLTWPYEATVENDPDQTFSYPYLFQGSDGAIHLGYSHKPTSNMRHVVFNEEFVKAGLTIESDPDNVAYEYAGGELTQVDACRYVNGRGTPGTMAAYACRQDVHPQDPDFPGVHVASLTETTKGDLLYAFYAGSQEGADDVATYMSRLSAGTSTWNAPEVVFDEPGKPDGNAVLWTDDQTGRVHLFFSTIMGDGWTDATLRRMYSDSNGHAWSDPTTIREEWGWLFGTRPFRMSNGELLVPIYDEEEWSSGFYVPSDDLSEWTPYPSDDGSEWPSSIGGSIQPTTVELDDSGHLLAYMRSRDRLIWQTESFDFGRTWSEAQPTNLPNNNSRVALLQLDSGNLLLAHNPTMFGRTPLRLSLSEDGGTTWTDYDVDVEDETGEEFSYPYLIQGSDGMIHLGYTHRRDTMRHLVFTEEFVRSGDDMPSNPDHEVKLEYRGGELHEVDECRYEPPRGNRGRTPHRQDTATKNEPNAPR